MRRWDKDYIKVYRCVRKTIRTKYPEMSEEGVTMRTNSEMQKKMSK